jgi:starch synthase
VIQLKVLFVTSEVFPLIKTGGLGDVSGSLPFALQNLNVDIRLLVPGYISVLENLTEITKIAELIHLPMIGRAELWMGHIKETKVPVMVLKAPSLYERDGGPYSDAFGNEWHDNGLRFGLLSKVAALLSNKRRHIIDWHPDIVHSNDWQSGLTPAYLKLVEHSRTKSVMSLHNMAFQGCFPPNLVTNLGLPQEHFVMDGLEYHGQLSFLKAGIFYADAISTVSPKYAQEIQTPAFGFGMEGLLAKRHHDIEGILNGIETDEWNPKTDPYLVKPYSSRTLSNKALVKEALQIRLNLKADKNAPILGVVSRLTHQKGLDLLLPIIQPLLDSGCQLALLGSGERTLEKAFYDLSQHNPNQVSVTIGYNEELSHQIMAGVDMFVMPSRFEPCGLNQLYGLAYGTPPIVNATGGLADSVVDTNKETLSNKTANGFVMSECSSEGLFSAITRSVHFYQNEPKIWQKIQKNGMGLNLSWDSSAKEYLAMYQTLLETNH